MAKRLFRKYIPSPDRIRWLGSLAHRPDLWHLNRHSASRAIAVGVFWGLIPIPLQTIPTVIAAIFFRANVALAWGVTWILYPFSFFFCYLAYTIGRLAMHHDQLVDPKEMTFKWIWAHFWDIGIPLYLGSTMIAAASAVMTYFGFRLFWTLHVRRRWMRRKHRQFPLIAKPREVHQAA